MVDNIPYGFVLMGYLTAWYVVANVRPEDGFSLVVRVAIAVFVTGLMLNDAWMSLLEALK